MLGKAFLCSRQWKATFYDPDLDRSMFWCRMEDVIRAISTAILTDRKDYENVQNMVCSTPSIWALYGKTSAVPGTAKIKQDLSQIEITFLAHL